MKRNFNEWLSTFRESIASYNYYVYFDEVYMKASKYKDELNILNGLIGSKDIENEFERIVNKYPEVINSLPILIAKRESEIYFLDYEGEFTYLFKKPYQDIEIYKTFMRKTGLFNLLQNHIVNNLFDYVTGVESGLSSNGRKNRGGHQMEDLVEDFLRASGLEYYKEMYLDIAESRWNLDLSQISNLGKTRKRFDFVVKTENYVYAIEVNFYTSGGSKLNETARSYKLIYEESKDIKGFKFVWFTDGQGWLSAKNNLEETFDVMDNIYNIEDLEQGIIEKIFI